MIRPTSKTVIARLVIAAAGLDGTAGVSVDMSLSYFISLK
jgi:hypothetical protein